MSEAEEKPERMLRIRISDLRSGVQKLNIGIPFTFVKLGLSIAQGTTPALRGIDTEGIIKAMESGASGMLIELEEMEKGHRVEVYIE